VSTLSLSDRIAIKKTLIWIGIWTLALNGFLGSLFLWSYLGFAMGVQ
jgi:hypothetical protein